MINFSISTMWQKLIDWAEAVIMLTPEYNSGIAPAQKNAIDWLYKEWQGKPVIVVGYSWSGAANSCKHLSEVLIRVGAKEALPAIELSFGKEITPNGEVIDEVRVNKQFAKLADGL